MFESIAGRLEEVFKRLRSRGRLGEADVEAAMREIRNALLEADVNIRVVREFTKRVGERALGQEVIKSVTPGQQVVKIVHDELVVLMGPVDTTLPAATKDRAGILMLAGLQGSGKTTTAGKLAHHALKKGRRPLLVAADVQRPAAIRQLIVLGEQVGVPVYHDENASPRRICLLAIDFAAENNCDLIILDTAGRLHVDDEMMAELEDIARRVKPDQVMLVCDAMTGQDAVNSAKAFNEQLELTGVILTKLDGDARGGAALSAKSVTGKPITFVGVGEKLDNLEEFHPDRMANRILQMGDVVTLVEKAQANVDQEKALKFQKKMRDASFTLDDFLEQLQQVRKMGPIQDLLGMIPGMGKQLQGMNIDEKEFSHLEAIIQSMTPDERTRPEMVNPARRRRIATGSGTEPADVNALMKQFHQLKKMMKKQKGRGRGGFPSLGFG